MIARVDQRIATANLPADTQLLGAAAVAAAARLPAASVRVALEVDSTNAELMSAPARDLFAPAVLIAARQSAGRGRRGRRWITDAPGGLAISIGVDRAVRSGAPRLIGLSPAIGVALAQALSAEAQAVELKWPNDLYRAGKKFAGVLVESRRSGETERVVVGVGLNWTLDARDAQAIDQPATGLFEAIPAQAERERIAGRIAAAVIAAVSGFFARGMGDTVRDWARFDRLAGREVVVSEDGVETLRGIADGIDADGALRVIVAGRTVPVAVGDVSVRPVSATTAATGVQP